MNISSIKGYSFSNTGNLKAQNSSFKNTFKGNEAPKESEYENPVSVKTEKALAVLSSVGISAVAGAVVAGLVSVLRPDGKLLSKIPLLSGAAGALLTLALILPSKLYHTKVNATVKEKEMDVFTVDKELKKDLTKEVHKEVKDPEISLDEKLKHNLQLQTANRASAHAVGITTF